MDNTIVSKETLAELKQLLDKATPSPHDVISGEAGVTITAGSFILFRSNYRENFAGMGTEHDARLYVLLRKLAPVFIEAVEKAERKDPVDAEGRERARISALETAARICDTHAAVCREELKAESMFGSKTSARAAHYRGRAEAYETSAWEIREQVKFSDTPSKSAALPAEVVDAYDILSDFYRHGASLTDPVAMQTIKEFLSYVENQIPNS